MKLILLLSITCREKRKDNNFFFQRTEDLKTHLFSYKRSRFSPFVIANSTREKIYEVSIVFCDMHI